MKKTFFTIFILFGITLFWNSVFALDSDNDGIQDNIDVCLLSMSGSTISSTGAFIGCSQAQIAADDDSDGTPNVLDAFPNDRTESTDTDRDGIGNNTDDDDDSDGLLDNEEENIGWTVRIPIEKDIQESYNFSSFQVISNSLRRDTDGDGVEDNIEKQRGLNPNNPDTDGDSVQDNIDTEITHSNGRLSVNSTGVYTAGATQTTDPNKVDSDGDLIPDILDKCPNTLANQIVDEIGDTQGCSAIQKTIDSDGDGIADYRDNDSDNDGVSDSDELQGWEIIIPLEITSLDPQNNFFSFTVSSDIRLKDTDGDKVLDNIEKSKGLNPRDSDTDRDGVFDDIDEEITSTEGRLYVNELGVYSVNIFNDADDDKDGIKNNADICPGTPSGSTVYSEGISLGCTPSQRVQRDTDSDFDGVPDSRDLCAGTTDALRKSVGNNGCVVATSLQRTYSMVSVAGSANNISIGGSPGSESRNVRANDKLLGFNENDQFIKVGTGGERGIYNTLLRIARDIKNLFYVISTIFFLIITLKLILATNTEEEVGKFKKGIIWITIGIIVMQIAYAFAVLAFDKGVSARLGVSLIENIVYPLIALLQTLASLFFIAMAFYAFYRLVTANGNEEAVSSGRMSIVYAFIGFLVVYFAKAIAEAFYGRINCESFSLGFISVQGEQCTNTVDITQGTDIIIKILNWFNGFVAIVVLIMILYAGAQILLSGGDEEKVKKGKQSLLYIAIGLFILVANYLILTFFLVPDVATGVI